jgi:hypothetical protein
MQHASRHFFGFLSLFSLCLLLPLAGCGGGGSGSLPADTNEITSAQSLLRNPDGAAVDGGGGKPVFP